MARGQGVGRRAFSQCRYALDKALRVVAEAVFVGDHVQPGAGPQQLARLQQEVGARRLAHRLVAVGKGLVQQQAAGRQVI